MSSKIEKPDEVEVLKPLSDYPTCSFADENENPTTSRRAMYYDDQRPYSKEKFKVISTHPNLTRSSSNGTFAGRHLQNKTSPSPSTSIDQQEKVSVRLVKEKGLVVDADDDEDYDEDSFSVQSASIMPHERQRYEAGVERRHTVGTDFKLSTYPTTMNETKMMISGRENGTISLSPSPECKVKVESKAKSRHNHNPFSRTRHGSSNGTNNIGVSSLVPLMDGIKESHKIEVVIKPAPTMMKTYNGSSIHLCCALVFVFSATIFSSLTLLLVKVLKNRDHHPISIAFWRYLGILVPSIPLTLFYILRGKRQKIFGCVWPLYQMDKATNVFALLMRAVLGSTAIILRYCSLDFLTIANTSVISYCAPVFAAIIAPFCLKKEKAGIIPVLIGILTCFAVFMMSKPPFFVGSPEWDNGILKGVLLSSSSMFCSSMVLISVRYLIERVHFSLILLVLGGWGVIESGILSLSLEVLKVPSLLPDIVMMIGIAVLSFFSQLFLLLAMRTGNIGCASVMKSCDILLSFLWQYLFLKTKADLLEILSTVIIILSVWFVCFRKWLGSLRANNVIRDQFSCLLH